MPGYYTILILLIVGNADEFDAFNFTRVELEVEPLNGTSCESTDLGLTNTAVEFQYRELSEDSLGHWSAIIPAIPVNTTSNVSESLQHSDAVRGLQIRLLQLEHGGGKCNCWKIALNIIITGKPQITFDVNE